MVLGPVALIGVLVACGTNGGEAPPSPTPTTDGATSTATTPSRSPEVVGGASVVLHEGVAQRLCGISVRVRFVPPSSMESAADVQSGSDQAFLVAGDTADDQPTPDMVSPARPGSVATVAGQRFQVTSVDIARKTVTVRLLC